MTPPIHVTITTDRNGSPIVSKLGRTPDAIARLKREAWILGRLRHPGVVELVELREVDDDLRLDLVLAGSRTLQDAGPLSAARVAGLLAAVATTLADVHTQGVGHRRLTADHIVLDRNGQPVIAGWAEAGSPHLGEDDIWVDPPAEDVVAIGVLLGELLDAEGDRTHRSERSLRRKLSGLAQTCQDERAPEMHELGRQLAQLAGDGRPSESSIDDALDETALADLAGLEEPKERRAATVPTASKAVIDGPTGPRDTAGPESDEPPIAPRNSLAVLGSPRGLLASSAVAVLLFGLLGWIVSADTSEPDQSDDAALMIEPPSTTVIQGDVTTIPATTPPAPAPARSVPLGECVDEDAVEDFLDTDGDGCGDVVEIEGNQVHIGETTYEVGRPGDTVMVGDWDCDGTATPIVFRPDDRAIHVFSRWARADQGLTAIFGGTVPPNTTASPTVDGEGCHVLELSGPAGIEQRTLDDLPDR